MQSTKAKPDQRNANREQPTEVKTDSSEYTATVTPEQRTEMIAVAAYFIAEKRGFAPGCLAEDWLAAEAQIDRHLSEKVGNAGTGASCTG